MLNYKNGGVYRTWLGINDRKEEGKNVYESDGSALTYEIWQNGFGINRDHLYFDGQVDLHDCAYVYHFTWQSPWYQGNCNWGFRYICERSEWFFDHTLIRKLETTLNLKNDMISKFGTKNLYINLEFKLFGIWILPFDLYKYLNWFTNSWK